MASEVKKRKVDAENRAFKSEWTSDYFFIEHKGNVICLICKESVSVTKNFNVKRHYNTKHASKYNGFQGSQRDDKINELKKALSAQQSVFSKSGNEVKNATKASYLVSELIAKKMKPFSDGEFVKECVQVIVETLCPEKSSLFRSLSLSNTTVTRRIEDLSNNIKQQLYNLTPQFESFSLALDESTDLSDTAQLAIFVRGIDVNFNIYEELLELRPMKDTCTGADIFRECQAAMENAKLSYENLVGISTDGAPAMVSDQKGFQGIIISELRKRNLPSNLIWCHCIIHQEALCAKVLGFKEVMKAIISDVNFIRAHSLNHRQFKQLLDDLDANYKDVIYFSQVRWLSQGRTLERVWQLRREISMFFDMKGRVHKFGDSAWLSDFAFLTDITAKLNDLNTALQGRGKLVHNLFCDVKAFQSKLRLWKAQLDTGNFDHFPCLKCLKEDGVDLDGVKYSSEVDKLKKEFDSRFKEFYAQEKYFELISMPFGIDPETVESSLQMELIELQCNMDLKAQFSSKSLIDFYKTALPHSQFPNLSKCAQKFLVLFGSTYICEQFFSKMKLTKSKQRSCLTDRHLIDSLRIASSNLNPDIDNILKEQKQFQKSH